MKERKYSIDIILVAYQSKGDLKNLLPELLSMRERLHIKICVVDNASSDGTAEMLAESYQWVKTILHDENKGFAAGVNAAEKQGNSRYVLLLNPDTHVNYPALESLKNYLDQHDDVAAAAPKILYPDGRLQPSRGSFPNFFRTGAHLLNLKRVMPDDEKIIQWCGRWLGSIFRQYSEVKEEQEVDYTTGACVLIRRSAFSELGGLDERFFLYYEEIDFGLRLKRAGYRWVFLNGAVVTHKVAASSDTVPIPSFEARYTSMIKYFQKHRPIWEQMGIRWLLRLNVGIRWLLGSVSVRFRTSNEVSWQDEKDMYKRLLRN